MKVREAIKVIEDDGWFLVRTRGSHRQYKHSPGCVATGATREELEMETHDAIQFHLEGLRLEGEPVPAPRSEARQAALSSRAAGGEYNGMASYK